MTDDETPSFPVDIGMVCSCLDRGPAVRALVDAVARRVKTTPDRFVTDVLWSLHVRGVTFESSYLDQWFALTARQRDSELVVVAADEFEAGLAAIWLYFVAGATPGLDED